MMLAKMPPSLSARVVTHIADQPLRTVGANDIQTRPLWQSQLNECACEVSAVAIVLGESPGLHFLAFDVESEVVAALLETICKECWERRGTAAIYVFIQDATLAFGSLRNLDGHLPIRVCAPKDVHPVLALGKYEAIRTLAIRFNPSRDTCTGAKLIRWEISFKHIP